MKPIDSYYVGYIAWRNTLIENNAMQYGRINFNEEKSKLSKQVVEVNVDKDWLDMFELCFPYIEKCINELRSFLYKDEDLILIEQANKIDVQAAIIYLSQHTDLILEYDEDTNNVVPSKIINSYYENTYSIYENLFIYTLVKKCESFIFRCSDDIEDELTRARLNIKYLQKEKKEIEESNNDFNLQISYQRNIKIDINDEDTSNLDVVRVRVLKGKVQQFLNSPLMKSLRGSTLLRPPLTMTNVLQKNPNFKMAVKLWDYILNYKGNKFSVSKKDVDLNFSKKNQKQMTEMFNLNNFLTKMYYDNDLKKDLETNYTKYKKELRMQQLDLEREQKLKQKNEIIKAISKQKELDRIVLEKTIEKFDLKIINIKNKYIAEIKNINDKHQNAIDNLKTRHINAIELLNDKNERKIIGLKKSHEKELNKQENQNNKKLAKLAEDYELKIALIEEYNEQYINTLVENHENYNKYLNSCHEKDIELININHEEEIKQIDAYNEKKINIINENHLRELNYIAIEKGKILDFVKEGHKKELQKYDRKISRLDLKYEKLIYNHNLNIESLLKNHQKELENLTMDKNNTIEELNNLHEKETEAFNYKLKQLSNKLAQNTVEYNATIDNLVKNHKNELDDKEYEQERASILLKEYYNKESINFETKLKQSVLKNDNMIIQYEKQIDEQKNSFKELIKKHNLEKKELKKEQRDKINSLNKKNIELISNEKSKNILELEQKDQEITKYKKELKKQEFDFNLLVSKNNQEIKKLIDFKEKEKQDIINFYEQKLKEYENNKSK